MLQLRQTENFLQWTIRLKDKRARYLIAARIDRLAFGHFGDARPVGKGISELRVHFGPGYRVYFQRRGDAILLLLCGGDKGTQVKDIETAKRLAEEWSEKDD